MTGLSVVNRYRLLMPTTLVLVPTDLERRLLGPALSAGLGEGDRLELCGFGIVAAAARTAALLATHAPDRVLLVGIAGRLDEALEIGGAYRCASAADRGQVRSRATDCIWTWRSSKSSTPR